jgi:hypothetical protein
MVSPPEQPVAVEERYKSRVQVVLAGVAGSPGIIIVFESSSARQLGNEASFDENYMTT